ncbi:glycosyltransferase [Phytohabitans kaempferiae]|uniref:Glycosyltransferase n=1 Tax=Phytohabitans kaempferiae TaxID=1620943 RepID=A0ABV6MD84_9ACTN
MTSRLDVVVPAHDERMLVGACLRALLCDAGEIDLRIVVVANGCTDDTADVVRAVAAAGSQPGREVVLVETATADKAHALNAADVHRRGCSVVYLDADTVLTPGTLRALAEALDGVPAPRLAGPRPQLVRPDGRLSRDFGAVWSELPAVAGQVIGAGCYAVNPAGRARWSHFPPVTADDAFVRSRFSRDEQTVPANGSYLLVLPNGWELVRVVRRWRDGNAELARSPSAGAGRNLRAVLSRPALWPHLPGFAFVTAASRLAGPARWHRAEGPRAMAGTASAGVPPTVEAIVVAHRGRATIDRCLASLRSAWASLAVTVVDNACPDKTADHVSAAHPGVALVRHDRNLGFAAAVNRAAAAGGSDYLLLVHPEVDLENGAVDELLALATRFPAAGLYGGREVDGAGDRRRGDVRPVPVLTAGVLLVDRALWRRLDGFDERHLHHGEDVDLCARARRLGARPMRTPAAQYRHRLGGRVATTALLSGLTDDTRSR